MDIKSIIDAEDHPPSRKSSATSSSRQENRPNPLGLPGGQAPVYENSRDIKPPQPSPLQTSAYNEPHFPAASSNDNLRSPYQRAPSFGLTNGAYPTPYTTHQSPHHNQQVLHYPQREGSIASGPYSGRSFGQTTPLSQTPTASTPGSASAYSNFPRPTSSHSIPTPSSVHNPAGFPRESPQPSSTHPRTSSQPQGAQQYISQPGTPLGPPTTYGRQASYHHQESPGEFRHHRSYSGSQYGQQESRGPLVNTSRSPSAFREQHAPPQPYHQIRERERSVSVSPKTKLPSIPAVDRLDPFESTPRYDPGLVDRSTPAKSEVSADTTEYEGMQKPKLARKPSRSIGVSGLLNTEPPGKSPEKVYHSVHGKSESSNDSENEVKFIGNNSLDQPFQTQSSSGPDRVSQLPHAAMTQASPTSQHLQVAPNQTTSDITSPPLQRPGPPSSFKAAALKISQSLIDAPLPSAKTASRPPKKTKRPLSETSELEIVGNGASIQTESANKKPRTEDLGSAIDSNAAKTDLQSDKPMKRKPPRISHWQDLPVYAQSVRGPQRTAELFQQNLEGTNRGLPATMQRPPSAMPRQPIQTNGTPKSHSQPPPQASPLNGTPAPHVHPQAPNEGSLGPWEFNVTDTEPADELTRIVADHLFQTVVLNNEAGVAPAGGGRGLGAVLEIEAKIGRLIDRHTNDRLRLPVSNECVIDHSKANMPIAFESSMTENQHRSLNQFLNKALVDSQGKQGSVPPRKPRIPMTYKHTHEIDAFYEISQNAALQLPHSVSSGLQLKPNARHRSKVRITTDEKTGEELAKIIKTRVADIDVYSPQTLFDWRISVNVEMDFDVDMRDLVAVEKRDGKADRRKDRVSYKHLKYQIDLTQVTPIEPANKLDKEHELEIEVSSEEVRKQGLLAMNNQSDGYFTLIKGFVDNVRLLSRYCKE